MLTGRNILCISNPSWEGDYAKTIVELMTVLAGTNKVLYVENPYTVKDVLTGLLKGKPLAYGKLLGWRRRVSTVKLENGGEVFLLTPPVVIPVNYLSPGKLYETLLQWNGMLLRRAIRKALKKLDMQERLVNIVAFNPALGLVCGRRFDESLLLYHCYDEIGAARWLKRHGLGQERRFMKMADAVIVTSQGLLETRQGFSKACFLVKNAVNFPLFSTAFRAEPMREGPKTVGYIGSIDDRLDFDLLEKLIRELPEVKWVFVGRVVDARGGLRLKKYPNVEVTGPRKVAELPSFLERFTVGIIPFLKNEFTKGIYPLKINEYLAAGLPVVSTDFGYLQDFSEVISIAGSPEAFKEGLLREMREDDAQKRLGRKKVASANSWERRAEEISDIVRRLEESKGETTTLLTDLTISKYS